MNWNDFLRNESERVAARLPLPLRTSYYTRRGVLMGNTGSTREREFVVDPQPENIQEFINKASADYHTEMNNWYIHKMDNPVAYYPTYDEAPLTLRFAMRGFMPDRPFAYDTNWFGVSTYDPNLTFVRDRKRIVMSLQGMAMPHPETDEDWALAKSCSCKYIGFFEEYKPLYQSWSGNLPEQNFIEAFIQ